MKKKSAKNGITTMCLLCKAQKSREYRQRKKEEQVTVNPFEGMEAMRTWTISYSKPVLTLLQTFPTMKKETLEISGRSDIITAIQKFFHDGKTSL